ncbi:SsrA-binding protein [Chitinophaga jiangningensis]|uniref:SsrA-binding protein n=1 Tax=Chitinophaga jiangningensis TaxID=1419482 RepID=A0A1M7MYD2_9BACT|nr:SsrA-binding protein [Chitinophaga jiangningensis]SHM96103.1 SsrA-binding protein [Chitinophaga jiangningensis]
MAELKNRSAYFEYAIEDKYIAGIVLTGTEIKSIRVGRVSFNDAFCYFHKGELFVKSLHIAEYSHGTAANHDPLRERKLLLTKKELRKLENKIKEKGYTIIPLRIFINEKSLAKMEIGMGKGKKMHDKRESIKQRESDRELRRQFK